MLILSLAADKDHRSLAITRESGDERDDLTLESVRKKITVSDTKQILCSLVLFCFVPAIKHESDLFEGRCWGTEKDLFMLWDSSSLNVESEDKVEELIFGTAGNKGSNARD